MIYWYLLSQKDLSGIKKSVVVNKHFDMEPGHQIFMVFVGKTKVQKEQCKDMLKAGISVASLVLTDADIAKIEAGDGIFGQYSGSGFEIGIITQETWDKFKQAKGGALIA